MKTIKQNIISILIGIGIGLSVNSTFFAFYATKYDVLNATVVFRSYIASLIIGVVSALCTKIFQREDSSLLQRVALHYMIILITVCFVGKWANWIGNGVSFFRNFIPFLGIFTAVYIMIYVLCYQIAKRNVDEINSALKKQSQQ